MTYNIKSLAKGALLGAAGLAMLTGCSTTRQDTTESDIKNSVIYAACKANGHITDAQLSETLRNTTYVDGTFLNQPTMIQGQPGYMRIELQDKRGRKRVLQVEYPNRTDKSSDKIAESLVQDLKEKEKSRKSDAGRMDLSMGFRGKVKPTGVITNSLSSYSIATSQRNFDRQ